MGIGVLHALAQRTCPQPQRFLSFLVDFAFVFKANSVDFKIKLLSWKECAAQCSLHRCPWRFIHCRRRLVSH